MEQNREVAIVNAKVRTLDERDAVASALLMGAGRIIAIGTSDEVRAAAASDAEIVDVNGRAVVPGFIDAHNHLSIAAFAPLHVDCTTPPLTTLDEVLDAIHRHVREIPPGQWVVGMGFHEGNIREQRNPSRYELDEVVPGNPFFLMDASCHMGIANSRALAEVGIDAHTPQPWGGLIETYDNGEPTGTLLETATNLLYSASWEEQASRDWERAVTLLNAKMTEYTSVGLTGVGDALVTPAAAELYRRADAAGMLPLTVQQLHGGDHFFAMQDLRRGDAIDRIKQPASAMLRGGTMKIFVDRAYPDGPAIDEIHDGCTRHVGTPFYSKSEVRELATRASELGIGTAIHAMGNCAVDTVLDAYEAVRRASGTDSILRMEHAFVADPRQGERLASLGVDLVANPGLGYFWGDVFQLWRSERQRHLRVLPVRSMIDAGVRVSLASDHPCGTFSPAAIMATAVNRKTHSGNEVDSEEAITAAEALRAYTINAAHASGRDSEEGSIEVGKRANVLVLDRDIVTCPVEEIRDMQVDFTYIDGRLIHERGAE
ncbi:amidohydrolase [Saccharopolyspora sp. NPDC049426]|uniref:amidohydrolase n=1 Tax=Saccharopolyspora sp. NPDC049426 TaxID=3155652 RepID=UPI0034157AD9